MIPFHSPAPEDGPWVQPLLAAEGLPLCNYSFPVLFCWKDAYGFQYAPLERRLLVRLNSSWGHSYLWPVGEGDPLPALEALTQDARAEGQPLRLIGLTLYHKNWLEDHYPGRFLFQEVRTALTTSTLSTAWQIWPGKSSTPSATTFTGWMKTAPAGPGAPNPPGHPRLPGPGRRCTRRP